MMQFTQTEKSELAETMHNSTQNSQTLTRLLCRYLATAVRTTAVPVALVGLAADEVAAQDSPPYKYDDEMLCRFVLDAVSSPRGADPSEVANNTDVGGYYWATQYDERGEPRQQFWFYPWTTFPDDARQDKGVGVVFNRSYSSTGDQWIAGWAYQVGFVDEVTRGTGFGRLQIDCNRWYPTGKVRQSSVPPLRWETMLPADCKALRERIANSPHPAPPGCE